MVNKNGIAGKIDRLEGAIAGYRILEAKGINLTQWTCFCCDDQGADGPEDVDGLAQCLYLEDRDNSLWIDIPGTDEAFELVVKNGVLREKH
jgi:hypothetical protein